MLTLVAGGAEMPAPDLSPGELVLRDATPDPFDIDPTPYRKLIHPSRMTQEDADALCCIARDDVFRRGQWSISQLTGATVANLGPMTDTPFGMVIELVRLNCVWNPPRPNKFFSGSFEGVAELDVMPVFNGPASIVVGGSLYLRYNFATCNRRRLGFYFQYGNGGMYTDAYLHGSPVLSSGFEFIIQMGLGARLMLGKAWALNTECNFYHFSNNNIVPPNVSVNEIAIVAGLTYYFKRR
jgi:hypothetical protein